MSDKVTRALNSWAAFAAMVIASIALVVLSVLALCLLGGRA